MTRQLRLVFGFIGLMVALVAASVARADGEATLVTYRADEAMSTKRVDFDVYLGETDLGRLKSRKVLVTTVPAGEYQLQTSFVSNDPVTIVLKPGAVHYVHAKPSLSGTSMKIELNEVEERAALVQQPAIESQI